MLSNCQLLLKVKMDHSIKIYRSGQGVLYFYEENGPNLTFSESFNDDEFILRVNEAFDSTSGKPFAKENLKQVTKWLHFQGLVVSKLTAGREPTPEQQIS